MTECKHGLEPEWCSYCLRPDDYMGSSTGEPVEGEPMPASEPFRARYGGSCAGCNLEIHVGQRIMSWSDGQYRHEECWQ